LIIWRRRLDWNAWILSLLVCEVYSKVFHKITRYFRSVFTYNIMWYRFRYKLLQRQTPGIYFSFPNRTRQRYKTKTTNTLQYVEHYINIYYIYIYTRTQSDGRGIRRTLRRSRVRGPPMQWAACGYERRKQTNDNEFNTHGTVQIFVKRVME